MNGLRAYYERCGEEEEKIPVPGARFAKFLFWHLGTRCFDCYSATRRRDMNHALEE